MQENPNTTKGFFDANPKMLFAFGLVVGVAVTAIFYSASWPVSAERDSGNDIVVNTGDDTAEDYVLAPVTSDDWIRGDIKKADIVLIEYSDFECPYCSNHHPTMKKVVEEYGDQVAWVYRHLPLSFHKNAVPSALASECAGEQGEFWAFADAMYEADDLNEDLYYSVAQDLGLDMDQFGTCYTSEKYADEVDDDLASAMAAGATGTPATFVNGQLVSGALPADTFMSIIDQILAE